MPFLNDGRFCVKGRNTKEHKKRKKPIGTGADEVAKEWEFYHLMDFLKDFFKHRKSVINQYHFNAMMYNNSQ